MITIEEKEKLVTETISNLGIKKTKTFVSDISPDKPDDYNYLKAEIENSKQLSFDNLEIDDILIVKNKDEIYAENCIFNELKFRNFTCNKVVFINCRFNDFTITGGNYPNAVFIACEFVRLNVKSSSVTETTDFTGIKLIRCKFDEQSRFSSTNLNQSYWIDTDINDVEIILDPNNPQKCYLNNYKGDDLRTKSQISNDVMETIQNIDVNTLEKELISSKEYTNEEIDLYMLVNTDLFNCRFTNCTFVSKKFDEAGLINYEIRLSFVNVDFSNCRFLCNFKSILFDKCKFKHSILNSKFIYCTFKRCDFIDSPDTKHTFINHSTFIECCFNEFNINELIKDSERGVEVSVCCDVKELQYIYDKCNEINQLEQSNTQLESMNNDLINEISTLKERCKGYDSKIETFDILKKNYDELKMASDLKDIEIRELNEKLSSGIADDQLEKMKQDYQNEINALKIEYENIIAELSSNSAQNITLDVKNSCNDLIRAIVDLINENTDAIDKMIPQIDNSTVTSYLANLNEDERMGIFSNAAIERMKIKTYKDGISSILDEDDEI